MSFLVVGDSMASMVVRLALNKLQIAKVEVVLSRQEKSRGNTLDKNDDIFDQRLFALTPSNVNFLEWLGVDCSASEPIQQMLLLSDNNVTTMPLEDVTDPVPIAFVMAENTLRRELTLSCSNIAEQESHVKVASREYKSFVKEKISQVKQNNKQNKLIIIADNQFESDQLNFKYDHCEKALTVSVLVKYGRRNVRSDPVKNQLTGRNQTINSMIFQAFTSYGSIGFLPFSKRQCYASSNLNHRELSSMQQQQIWPFNLVFSVKNKMADSIIANCDSQDENRQNKLKNLINQEIEKYGFQIIEPELGYKKIKAKYQNTKSSNLNSFAFSKLKNWPLVSSFNLPKNQGNQESANYMLLGDVAHRAHPLAGQGLNLTLSDCQTLVKIINDDFADGLGFDAKKIIAEFLCKRSPITCGKTVLFGIINSLGREAKFAKLRVTIAKGFKSAPFLQKLARKVADV